MKNVAAVIGLLLVVGHAPARSDSQEKFIEGLISRYACGDNCYLTIIDKNGREHTALCAAALCEAWNERAAGMPSTFKGKKVRVTVGRGPQYFGDGSLAGETDSFDRIDLLK